MCIDDKDYKKFVTDNYYFNEEILDIVQDTEL